MSQKVIFDLLTWVGGPALVLGVIGFVVGVLAFDQSDCILGTPGCVVGGGSVFGIEVTSQETAGFVVGGAFALVGLIGGSIYRGQKGRDA